MKYSLCDTFPFPLVSVSLHNPVSYFLKTSSLEAWGSPTALRNVIERFLKRRDRLFALHLAACLIFIKIIERKEV